MESLPTPLIQQQHHQHNPTNGTVGTHPSNTSSSQSTALSSTLKGAKKQTFKAVEKKKWRTLRRILRSRFGRQLCMERETSGLTLLAACAGFDAPVDILQLVFSLDPTQPLSQDDYGAVALHVACLNGSQNSVIEFLVKSEPRAVLVADIDNRIPLHHALECLCQREVDAETGKANIMTLYRSDTTTINYADKNGDTPVDMVQVARNCEYGRQLTSPKDSMTTATSENLAFLEDIYEFVKSMAVMEYTRKRKLWEGHFETLSDTQSLPRSVSSSYTCSSRLSCEFDIGKGEGRGGGEEEGVHYDIDDDVQMAEYIEGSDTARS
jgi:hypothetical protein